MATYCAYSDRQHKGRALVLSLGNQPVREYGGKDQPPSLKRESASAPPGQVSLATSGDSSQSASLPAIRVPDFAARHDLSFERALKRAGDLLGALLLAVVFSPIFMLAFLMAVLNGQKVLFRHQRVGRDGRLFYCLKFRTMVPNAEELLRNLLESDPVRRSEWERDHKLKDDPRVTSLGHFLRATSLDELPQIWNVLKGDMSLVGPRPVTRGELLRYGRNAVIYQMVRPGLTGLWQVSGRNFVEYRKRVAMDVVYVKRQSLVLDLWILLKTVVVVLTGHGAF
jgi:lipopolysaccharide/colanic/teichoic acid biosynthesis glycosyltransferase